MTRPARSIVAKRSVRTFVVILSGEFEELREPALSGEQIAKNNQRPAVADDVERRRNGTAGSCLTLHAADPFVFG